MTYPFDPVPTPAFPGIVGPTSEFAAGMELRDYFAAKALPELLYCEGDRQPFCDVAKMAYEMADAMLLARSEAR